LEQAHAVEMAPNNSTHEWLAKQYGIKGIPVLSSVSSLSFPSSFPYDFMHLMENLIPNLISFWTGDFKDLDHQNKGYVAYVIAPHIWNEIGVATAACGATNITTKQFQMTAEMYSNWTLYIAPIVLRGRFEKTKYYTHFMQLVKVIKLCLAFEIDEAAMDQIDNGFKSWVREYEQ
jgi:hypothetical protein